MSHIITCTIDQLKFEGDFEQLGSVKSFVVERFHCCLGYWENDMKGLNGYQVKEHDLNSGITLYSTDRNASIEKYKHGGRFKCLIPGNVINGESIYDQWRFFAEVNSRFKIVNIHLKVRIANPRVSFNGLKKKIGIESVRNGLNPCVIGFKTATYMLSKKGNSAIASPTIQLSNGACHKQLVIYDPLEKHGEFDCQDWELRIRGIYMHHALWLLDNCQSESEFAETIKSIVFGSIDFRDNTSPHISRRKRHQWYERLINGIEPIKLKTNDAFDKWLEKEGLKEVVLTA